MIKDLDRPHIDKIISALHLPAASDALIKRHLEQGAILVKMVDEDIFMTRSSAEILYESLVAMLDLGARQKQALLVIELMARASARPYDQLWYWQQSGGVAVALEPNEVEPFFRMVDRWIEGRS